jgi:sialate O-acetylesterase
MKLADVMCIVQAWAITGILLCPAQAAAEVELPKIFSDNMVLQRDMQVAVWGWATPGEVVTVEFAGQSNMDGSSVSIK